MRALALLLVTLPMTGCGSIAGALVDAGFRELDDHGSHARYEQQSYGAHFGDALGDALAADDDDDCEPPPCRTEVRVHVDHHHRR